MRALMFSAVLGLCAVGGAAARAAENNFWPFWVEQTSPSANGNAWSALGPLAFKQTTTSADALQEISGFRPLYVQRKTLTSGNREVYVLYPLFLYRGWGDAYRWSLFELINFQSPRKNPDVPGAEDKGFDLWPFYFSRETGHPETSYHAVFPIYGSLIHRFGEDRMSWVLFPLYGRFEKRGVVTTTAPWPFVKVLRGEDNHGLELWPLFGRREKPGAYREQYYLWPIFTKNESALWQTQPNETLSVLPFYLRDSEPGAISETYVWPFFGYTDRTAPYRYHETRYLWPIFVQGRGDDRYLNRWGPFYTHSIMKGADTTWILWPLWRQQRWSDAGIDHRKQQFFYFLYRSEEQRRTGHSTVAPARKLHVWPLFSLWDNGAGRKQIQVLSPLEVFFPANDAIRISYGPLFSIYRYDRKSPQEVRQSFLWDFITSHREADRDEFHVGPLFSRQVDSEKKRIAFGAGLLGWERAANDRRAHFFFFDFNRRSASSAPSPK